MKFWGRTLTGGLEASIRFLEALGARGMRWEWKKRSWRQALECRIASWENLERGVRARMRMCPSCRTLADRRERTCPSCGTSLRGAPGGGFGRLLRLLLPGFGSVTLVLLTVNVAMSLLIHLLWGGGEGGAGLRMLLAPPEPALNLLGDKRTEAVLAGEVWRLVTANYLHFGVIHLAVNCYSLANLGPLIEESFGARKFFLIYTVTGIAAFTASTVFSPYARSVGASGALFGLLGFAVVYGRYRGGPSGRAISEHLMRYLLLGLMMIILPGIDNAAHIGGAMAGALLGLFVESGEPRTPGGRLALNLLTAAAVLVTLGSFAAVAVTYQAHLRALAR